MRLTNVIRTLDRMKLFFSVFCCHCVLLIKFVFFTHEFVNLWFVIFLIADFCMISGFHHVLRSQSAYGFLELIIIPRRYVQVIWVCHVWRCLKILGYEDNFILEIKRKQLPWVVGYWIFKVKETLSSLLTLSRFLNFLVWILLIFIIFFINFDWLNIVDYLIVHL